MLLAVELMFQRNKVVKKIRYNLRRVRLQLLKIQICHECSRRRKLES